MSQEAVKKNLKLFFIKLVAIVFAAIIVINVSYNLIIAERLRDLTNKNNIEKVKNKIRSEIKSGLDKDAIFNKEDKILLKKFYLKVKKEFNEIE
tara:strand:- start:247 stop:528 length:282 start_codon:yes stop_codon:yes gene_type:complete